MAKDPLHKPKRFASSLMAVFREAHAQRDSKKDGIQRDSEDESVRLVNPRSVAARQGMTQTELKRHLAEDLIKLLNSINLSSALDLSQHDRVAKSVLNYGLDDLSSLTLDDVRSRDVLGKLRTALIEHEPRLIAKSVQLEFRDDKVSSSQKVAFDVVAEMAAEPADVPLEFVAELDVSEGKVQLKNDGQRL